ncbi:MAG: DNA polymerase I, partial [Clostridia bacterium]|nr:DNA polymerase I [Clostridia bacterium]
MRNILVVDGNSIINRAFYGLRLLQTAQGKYTNAIYGMVNMISRQIESLNPTYAAVAFDVKAPTFRHQMFDAYKAGRRPTPPELLSQFPDAKDCLRAMGIHVLELPGWEADDLQGTVASMTKTNENTHAYILTGDRDLLQLIDENITVLLAGNHETTAYDKERFFEKYGILPSQYVDAKALMGDSSDNIPGVPGIGEKTAMKLISLCGSLDGVYDALEHKDTRTPEVAKALTDSVARKLTEGKDSAYLSQKLARICTDAPMSETLSELTYEGVHNDQLYRLFVSLEFHGFLTKFKLTPPAAKADDSAAWDTFTDDDLFEDAEPSAPVSPTTEKSFILTEEEISAIPQTIYTDINALCAILPDAFAISYSDTEIHFYAESIGECTLLFANGQLPPSIFKNKEIICYDSKALWHTLSESGITLKMPPKDVMLEGYLWRGGDGQIKVESLCLALLRCQSELFADKPAALLWHLNLALTQKLKEEGMYALLTDIELPLAIVLAEMEKQGFKLDRAGMISYGEELSQMAEGLTERIYAAAGHPFNIQSPKQLGQVLFEELGLPAKKKTKSGFSTDAETLEKLKDSHAIVADILEYRQVTKLLSTYAVGLVSAADKNDRIHTDFKQAHTATGRLSSAEPNLQNIPVRTKMGERMREFFITEPNWVLLDADYSQIELRLLAHLSGDEAMLEAFRQGIDIHASTASTVFGVPLQQVTGELRKRAKAINFGIVYGMGAYSLSEDLQIPPKQAKEYIDSYMASYPKIAHYLENTIAEATENGYTTTLLGRRRYIPQLKSTKAVEKALGRRLAMNSPIQGTAADIMKLAMICVDKRLKADVPSAHLVMQVHDELIVEVPQEESEKAARLLSEEMEKVVSLALPLVA